MSNHRVTRREAIVAPLLAGLASPLLAKGETRPNILFILVDDLRYNALGYTGHPFVKTPNIDRIAREGVIFENAFASSSVSQIPAASLSSGSNPWRVPNATRN